MPSASSTQSRGPIAATMWGRSRHGCGGRQQPFRRARGRSSIAFNGRAKSRREDNAMSDRTRLALATLVLLLTSWGGASRAQDVAQPYGPNDAPNPYRFDYGWAK